MIYIFFYCEIYMLLLLSVMMYCNLSQIYPSIEIDFLKNFLYY
jgi:hypothetical protein